MRQTLLILWVITLAIKAQGQLQMGQPPSKQAIINSITSQPLYFTENQGQWDEGILYKADAQGASFGFYKGGVAYLFTRNADDIGEESNGAQADITCFSNKPKDHKRRQEALIIKAQFVGSNPDPEIIPDNHRFHNCNYFYGNDPTRWRTKVTNYSSITYKDIWPGIDLKYYGNGQGMKYDFIVSPGADLSQIEIRYSDVEDVSITSNGDLQLTTKFGFAYENKPYVYQDMNGRRVEIEASYVLRETGVFGFWIRSYNPAYPLIIDPELIYSTYLGGVSDELFSTITIDPSNNIYITGRTYSQNFPMVNPFDSTYSDGGDIHQGDIYVAKLSANGDSLIYSTYLGGSWQETANDIAVDPFGNAYITGEAQSDFPYTYMDTLDYAVFVTKLSPSGDSLIYSRCPHYFGDSTYYFSGGDYGKSIALNSYGEVFILGSTNSSHIPIVNPYDSTYNGGYGTTRDLFVMKISQSGDSIIYSTYLGGSINDDPVEIAIDDEGNAYVTGNTLSQDFPTVNAYDYSYNDDYEWDVVVCKLSPEGNSLVYSTYLGGNTVDCSKGIAVDTGGNAYVVGYTNSANFPTQNPFQTTRRGTTDAFVTKLSAAGNSLDYSTFLGGSGNVDYGLGIVVDGMGSAHIMGGTTSSDFPVKNAYDSSYNGGGEVFVTIFSPAGDSLTCSTFLGGTRGEPYYSGGIAIDTVGNIYVSGRTVSFDFPTINAFDYTYNDSGDAFIAKLSTIIDTPTVLTVSPEQYQLMVPINTDISAKFNLTMNVATINDSTFIVIGSMSGQHTGIIAYNAPTRTITLNPENDFEVGEIVTATLTSAIKSIDGVSPESSFSWTFTIETIPSSGQYDSSSFILSDTGTYGVVTAFINNDNCLDLATVNTYANSISIFLGNCDGTFSSGMAYPVGNLPRSVYAADFDEDGFIDLTTANSGSENISVLINNGLGGFILPCSSYSTLGSSWGIYCSDFNGDGHIDIAATTGDTGTVTLFFNDGHGIFPSTPNQICSTQSGAWGIYAADFDNNYYLDLVVTSGSPTSAKVFINDGSGIFPSVPSGSYSTQGNSWGAFCANFDGDNAIDLVVTNPDVMIFSYLPGSGDGSFPSVEGSYSTEGGAQNIMCADFDGDSDQDVAVSNGDSGTIALFFNNGNGSFASTPDGLYYTPGNSWGLAVGDFNNDGYIDLANANSDSNGVAILWNGPLPCSYMLGDINSDGQRIGGDVTYGVRYFKSLGPQPPDSCFMDSTGTYLYVAGDVNGNCEFRGSDITRLVSYFKGISSLSYCHFFPLPVLR